MTRTYEDANVGCPYYNEEGAKQIICEGLQDRATMQQHFLSRGDKMDFKKHYCCNAWKSCPLTKALNQKYNYEA
ncbi:MAG: hypothetical protein IKU07_09110 [Oscillospiraceae bacterium]|nr:hypothetical protein [Oscillospiraceae bacterium]